MPYDGGYDVIDVVRERRAGPEERRTTGGLPYRVSRTNTPDLGELRRELDRQRASAHRQGAGWQQSLRQACVGDARTCFASVAATLLTRMRSHIHTPAHPCPGLEQPTPTGAA